jgi:hypothetical protein
VADLVFKEATFFQGLLLSPCVYYYHKSMGLERQNKSANKEHTKDVKLLHMCQKIN